VARIAGAKGLQGALRLELLTDWPEGLAVGARLYLDGEADAHTVTGLEAGGRSTVVLLEGVATRDQAARLLGRYLEVESRTLPDGAYFWHQIQGLRVTDPHGGELGTVTEVFRAGENEVYVITGADGAELLVPALRSVVREIDLAAGRMVVDYAAEEVR